METHPGNRKYNWMVLLRIVFVIAFFAIVFFLFYKNQ